MPSVVCHSPRCPEPAVKGGYCIDHRREQERGYRRAGHPVYRTSKWQHTRERYLIEHPLCECSDPACRSIAEDVHHIKDIADGGNLWSEENLEALNHACHSKITRRRMLE